MTTRTKPKYVEGELLSQCPQCKDIKVQVAKNRTWMQSSIVLFDHLPHELCVKFVQKSVDMGIAAPLT